MNTLLLTHVLLAVRLRHIYPRIALTDGFLVQVQWKWSSNWSPSSLTNDTATPLLSSQGSSVTEMFPTSNTFNLDNNACTPLSLASQSMFSRFKKFYPDSFNCPSCDYTSTSRNNVRMHMNTHTGEKPFKCSHCNYASAFRHNVLRHVKMKHCESPVDMMVQLNQNFTQQ